MSNEEEDAHVVIKTRLKHLLSAERYVSRIHYAVDTIHKVSSVALSFGKLAYLKDFDTLVAENGGVFDRAVADRIARLHPVDAEEIEGWMDVVSSDIDKRIGRPFGPEKKSRLQALDSLYRASALEGLLPEEKTTCQNLSFSKGHAASQLAVNYGNNVHCHYDKYVRRFVRVRLMAATRAEHGIANDAPLPSPIRRQLDRDIGAVSNDLLESRNPPTCREELRPWVATHSVTLMPLPPRTYDAYWRYRSQKEHPERWLPYMVAINRMLEADGAKLFSPLPLRTSFTPTHVRIDTPSLVDLLVKDGDDALVLKAALEEKDMPDIHGLPSSKYNLPGLQGKATKKAKGASTSAGPKGDKNALNKDLRKIASPETASRVERNPQAHGAAFKTVIWQCLTKLGSNGKVPNEYDEKVFNNVIDTDGYSASLHYVSPSMYGMTRFNGGFKVLKASQRAQAATEKAKGAKYVTELTPTERSAILASPGVVLSCDPGKGCLALVTDGTGRVTRYTAAQRRVESRAKEHRRNLERLLDVRRLRGGTTTARELQDSIGVFQDQPEGVPASRKSCSTERYKHYLRTRSSVEGDLMAFYRRTVFRAQRYDAHIGRKASEDRFASRIKAKFGRVAAILYGDWGRNPNIRHQPPSPGVGLRRKLASYFEVFQVREAYTSSFCPRCRSHGMGHPRNDAQGSPVHHLLKCSNARCSCHWWHRDVLGALNILTTGKHALRTGSWDPLFAAPAA